MPGSRSGREEVGVKILSWHAPLVLPRPWLWFQYLRADEVRVSQLSYLKWNQTQNRRRTNVYFWSLETLPFLSDEIPLIYIFEKATAVACFGSTYTKD